MALLENLEQREILDHVVSNGSWDSDGASGYHFCLKDALKEVLGCFGMDSCLFDLC